MQQKIAKAQNSGNLRAETDRTTHDTEVLAAVGVGAERLTSLLLRVRDAAQPLWLRQASIILSQDMKRYRISRDISIKIAASAIVEWAHPHCPSCNGAKEIIRTDGVRIVCPKCDGVGVRRHSNKDRERMIGAAYKGKIQEAYEGVLNGITNLVSRDTYEVTKFYKGVEK